MGKNSAAREARYARQEEEGRQRRIKAGTESVRNKFKESFDQKYYDDMLQKVNDYYIGAKDKNGVFQPGDVTTQFENARKQMQAALLRSGLADSTVGAQKEADATEQFERAKQDVQQRGIAMQQQRRQQVADAENTVTGQLINTADMAAANANATQAIRSNYEMPSTPFLGQLFTDMTAGLATQAEMERRGDNRYTVFGRIPGWSGRSSTKNVGG